MAATPYPAYNDCCLRDSQDEAPAPTPGHIHRPGLQPLRRMAATPYPAYNDCRLPGSPDEAPAQTPGHIHRPGLQPLRRMAATPSPAYNDCCLPGSPDEAPAPTPGHIHRSGSSLYAGWRLRLIRPTTTAACPVARTRRLRRLRVIFIGPGSSLYAGWRLRLIRPTTAKLRFLRRRHQRYFPASGWVSNAAITAASAASLKPCFGSSTPSPKRVCSVS